MVSGWLFTRAECTRAECKVLGLVVEGCIFYFKDSFNFRSFHSKRLESEKFFRFGNRWKSVRNKCGEWVDSDKLNPYLKIPISNLPRDIELKKTVLKIYNIDSKSFASAVNTTIFRLTGDSQRILLYPSYSALLNFHGIEL